jgi:hypothetical protein
MSSLTRLPTNKNCAHSGKALNPGDRLVCFLYQDKDDNQWMRADILEEHSEIFAPKGKLLAKWKRIISEPEGDPEKARNRSLIEAAESLFVEIQMHQEPSREQIEILYLIAIILERKRRIKAVGKTTEKATVYYHAKNESHHTVPRVQLDRDQMTTLAEKLDTLLSA